MKSLIAFVVLLSSVVIAAAEHKHGVNVPDWYDAGCCSNNDCRPVADEDVAFEQVGDEVVVRYVPTGNTFRGNQLRKSQDERYHACINPDTGASLCFYLRTGV